MIIYISDTIKDCITSGSLSPTEIGALEDIASTVRSGDHLVLGDAQSLFALTKFVKLGTSARTAFKSVFVRVPQQESILEKVEVYVKIIPGDGIPSLSTIGNQKIICIPLTFCADMNFRTPLEIIFEEINDRYIYEIITEWYVSQALDVRTLNRKYRPIHGGGNRTYSVFERTQSENNSFCLCITDSDKKFPTDDSGATSTKVRESNDATKVLAHHLDLDFHEIENLVPLSFIADKSNSRHTDVMIAALKTAEQNGHQEAKLFYDYKKGLKYSLLHSCPDARNYWGTALPAFAQSCTKGCPPETCKCDLLKPLQNRAEMRLHIEQLTPICPNECPILEALWKSIGSTLTSWSAAAPARLV
ncbi:hypothetical protein [Pseudomonas sp. GV085]|uniref:hypothetical protein n=1 Tax=Pseudomonas sp. GV085 TaxID=2135756 RepID=UPI000D4BC3D2|nr:hypothetical protein [Pseudomonas sp. GV085]PTR25848.1 hypothetical protein C8K63_1041 [Pseudomonas sp. GV085]